MPPDIDWLEANDCRSKNDDARSRYHDGTSTLRRLLPAAKSELHQIVAQVTPFDRARRVELEFRFKMSYRHSKKKNYKSILVSL